MQNQPKQVILRGGPLSGRIETLQPNISIGGVRIDLNGRPLGTYKYLPTRKVETKANKVYQVYEYVEFS